MTVPRSSSCERTRFLAALAPDQTLSETEERMLARHLERCPACSSFASSVAAFTGELRAAPPAEPEGGARTVVVSRPRRSRIAVKLPLVALTAAAAGVLMTAVVLHSGSPATVTQSAPPVIVVDSQADSELAALRQLRDMSLARRLEPEATTGQPGIYLG